MCNDQMKVCTFRGVTILVGAISLVCGMVLIYYFVDLFVGDLRRYSEGKYFFSVFEDKKPWNTLWNNLEQSIKDVFTKICDDFNKHNSPHKRHIAADEFSEGAVLSSFSFEKSARLAGSPRPRLEREATPPVESFSQFTAASVKIVAVESTSWPWTTDLNRTTILNVTAPSITAWPRHQSLLQTIKYYMVFIENGTIQYKDLPGRDYSGLAAYATMRDSTQEAPQVSDSSDSQRPDSPGTVFSRVQMRRTSINCSNIVNEYFDRLNESIGVVRMYFVESAEGRLHIVFMVLNLILVLLNGLLCIASYILIVGARRTNRVFVIPWICISGVSIYGSILFTLWHMSEESGLWSIVGGDAPVWLIVFIVLAVVGHIVFLILVHLFLWSLFLRDSRHFEE